MLVGTAMGPVLSISGAFSDAEQRAAAFSADSCIASSLKNEIAVDKSSIETERE